MREQTKLSQWHGQWKQNWHADIVLVNFHGQVVSFTYAPVGEYLQYLVDLTGEPTGIRMMLPARTRLVENEALRLLQAAIEQEAFRYIQRRGSHQLKFQEYCRARELGIELPEAQPAFTPRLLSGEPTEPVEVTKPDDWPLAKCYRLSPACREEDEHNEANVHLLSALGQGENPFIVVEISPDYDGYSWAKLPLVDRVEVLVGKELARQYLCCETLIAVESLQIAAAEECCQSIARRLGQIPYSVSKLESLLDRRNKEVPTLSMILDELKALQEEFDEVAFNADEQALCAVTEPITLADTYLGPFRMALYPDKLREMYCKIPYFVIAVEPHPSAKDEAITHPHVSNEVLCEGEGAATIRAALEEGRLCDFFVMVRGILTTYNPDSPYVSLADWDGVACYDCGYLMDDESVYHCSHCDTPVCDNCSRVCTDCGEIVCGNCSSHCEICDRSLCPKCAKNKCSDCEAICCESCLTDGLCPDCQKEKEQEDAEQESETMDENSTTDGPQTIVLGGRLAGSGAGAEGKGPAIQPDSLGQAAVLPGQIPQ